MPAIVWLRRDLRVHDHPALVTALERHGEVVPFFCLDDRLLHGRNASGPRTQFLLECLADLQNSLEDRGGRLAIRRGRPEHELVKLAAATGARDVYFTGEVTPFGRARDRRVHEATTAAGLRLHACPGLTAVDDVGDLRTKGSGRPYTVFSPFFRAWLAEPRRAVLAAPERIRVPAGVEGGALPTLEELGLVQEVTDPIRGGEAEGRRRVSAFLAAPVRDYEDTSDSLGADRTSRLSPFLHFGCVSPREIESGLAHDQGAAAFRRQLAWREFYQGLILHFPGNAVEEFQERYRGSLAYPGDDEAFERWTRGTTGFPLVDAGMRQLRHEGWMHNRARLVVGSFLTKDLGVDWRRGERWFMRLLIDGDEASNNGNWQWIASVGADPQPFFRRIYSPRRHMERYDPGGRYVRHWVPELRGVPDPYLREPWTMPPALQREMGCVIGTDYPPPMVDRRSAREAAFERYRSAGDRHDARAGAS
jgi:deoxyribodipyrimidine photo-lyase